MTTDTLGQVNLLECPFKESVMNSVQQDRYLSVLKIMEAEFECAGICSDTNFFLFSDVRNGPPKKKCRTQLIESVNKNATFFASWLMVIGIIGLAGFVLSFTICLM